MTKPRDLAILGGGFTQTGAGAVQRTVESKLQDVVSVKDFGAVGDGVADDTAAIQAAINQTQTSKKALYFPSGTYLITTTLTSSSSGQLVVVGEGLYRSIIKWGAASAGILWDAGAWGLDLREIQLNGRAADGTSFWRAGDTGIKTTGVIAAQNFRITGFERQIEWAGGYYHRFSNCIFDKFSTCFYGGAVYNLHFSQCRWFDFIDGIRYTGGSGPITFSQCTIERWTGTFCQAASGATSAIDFEGCYFENYPDVATTPPMAAGFYENAVVCNGLHSLKVAGCNISVKGIRRFLNASGAAVPHLTSVGNRINYASGAATTCEYIFYASSYGSLLLADSANPNLTETTGTYTTSYISGTRTNPTRCSGYNAISGADLSNKPDYEEGTWTPVMSGSGGSAGSFSAVSLTGAYVKTGNQVTAYFRLAGGITNLGSWTGDVRISLPFAAATPNPAIVVGPVGVRVYGTSGSGYIGRVDDNETYFVIQKYPGGPVLTPERLQWSDLSTSASGTIFATLTYIAA